MDRFADRAVPDDAGRPGGRHAGPPPGPSRDGGRAGGGVRRAGRPNGAALPGAGRLGPLLRRGPQGLPLLGRPREPHRRARRRRPHRGRAQRDQRRARRGPRPHVRPRPLAAHHGAGLADVAPGGAAVHVRGRAGLLRRALRQGQREDGLDRGRGLPRAARVRALCPPAASGRAPRAHRVGGRPGRPERGTRERVGARLGRGGGAAGCAATRGPGPTRAPAGATARTTPSCS